MFMPTLLPAPAAVEEMWVWSEAVVYSEILEITDMTLERCRMTQTTSRSVFTAT